MCDGYFRMSSSQLASQKIYESSQKIFSERPPGYNYDAYPPIKGASVDVAYLMLPFRFA